MTITLIKEGRVGNTTLAIRKYEGKNSEYYELIIIRWEDDQLMEIKEFDELEVALEEFEMERDRV